MEHRLKLEHLELISLNFVRRHSFVVAIVAWQPRCAFKCWKRELSWIQYVWKFTSKWISKSLYCVLLKVSRKVKTSNCLETRLVVDFCQAVAYDNSHKIWNSTRSEKIGNINNRSEKTGSDIDSSIVCKTSVDESEQQYPKTFYLNC